MVIAFCCAVCAAQWVVGRNYAALLKVEDLTGCVVGVAVAEQVWEFPNDDADDDDDPFATARTSTLMKKGENELTIHTDIWTLNNHTSWTNLLNCLELPLSSRFFGVISRVIHLEPGFVRIIHSLSLLI